MRKIIILIYLIMMVAFSAHAAPAPSGVSGTLTHGESITITGTDFGTKSPAKPLMWDDCESETDDTPPSTSTENAASQVPYSDVMPRPANVGDAWELEYRNAPHTAVSTPVAAPHANSSKFLVGGHEDTGTFSDGSNVAVTVAAPAAAERWFATFYYRVDPAWPTPCQSAENHKVTVFQTGTTIWGNNQYRYMDLTEKPCDDSGYISVKAHNGGMCGGTYDAFPDTTPPWYYNMSATEYADKRMNSPLDGWVRFEQRISNDQGSLHFLVDNADAWHGTGNTDFFTGTGENDLGYTSGIRSFSVGGYYRYTDIPSNTVHDDAFRYFDDIYVDSTLSRVMIGNGSTYATCTILEPQPPTAWATGSITVTLNKGALDDSGWVYVFDSDGTYNTSGYFIEFGAGDSTPPTFSSASIASNGTAVTVNFNEPVSTTGIDADDLDLDCSLAGNDVALTYASGTGTSAIILTAGVTIGSTDTCTLDFDASVDANDIEDVAGNDLVTFSNQTVTNSSVQDTVALTFVSATVDPTGLKCTVTFSETAVVTGYDAADCNLDCDGVSGADVSLTSPTGSGTSREFTIASAIQNGETCNLDFVLSTDDIEDVAGNDMVSINDQAVTNYSIAGKPPAEVEMGAGPFTVTITGGSLTFTISAP